MTGPLNKRLRGMGLNFFPPVRFVYFTDQTENGHFPILGVFDEKLRIISTQILDFNQKNTKSNFTDQNMTIWEFPGRSVKYTKREFYISGLGSAVDLKF